MAKLRGGAEPPSQEELERSNREHMEVLEMAMEVYKKRNARYGDAWRRSGWRGTLTDLRRKIERAWSFLWHAEPVEQPKEGEIRIRTDDVDIDDLVDIINRPEDVDIDDLVDIINYAAFSIRAIKEGNRDGYGGWW